MADTPLPLVTLDMLLPTAASAGSEHRYGVLVRTQRAAGDVPAIKQCARYPAPFRLESQDPVAPDWGVSDCNRKARCFRVAHAGRARLARDVDAGRRRPQATDAALGTTHAGLAP